jgi:hypothetical protein
MTSNIELKGLLDTIMQHFMEIMSIKPFQPKVNDFLRKEFIKSLNKVEVQLKPAINFVTDNQEVELLNNYVFQNLQNHADQIGDQLSQELQRGMLDKESATELKKRVKDVFTDTKYTDRMKTVIRTEKLRANNAGAFSGAEQAKEAGIVLRKYLNVTMDKRTSDICKAEVKKYGTKEQSIPLEEDFIVKVGNKTYKAKYSPFHVNCRTVIRFTREEK